MSSRALVLAVLATFPLAGFRAARADFDGAPDVVVMCDATLQPAIRAAGTLFRARTGVPVRVLSAPGHALIQQIARNERDDILVTFAPAMDEAVRFGQARADTRVDGWRDSLALAGRGTATAPLTATALAAAVGQGKLAITDPTPAAAINGPGVLARLGMTDALAGHLTGTASTGDAAFLVANGSAVLGLVYATDLRPAALSAAFAVPAGGDSQAAVAAALSRNTASKSAPDFLAFLHSAEAARSLQDAGLESTP